LEILLKILLSLLLLFLRLLNLFLEGDLATFSLFVTFFSPIPSKAKRLFDEGKISSTEYVTLLTSDKNFHEDEDIDNIPWLRISKDTMEATGPLIVMIEDEEMSPQKRAPSSPLVPPPSPAPPAPTPEKDEPVDRSAPYLPSDFSTLVLTSDTFLVFLFEFLKTEIRS
jgi:hypothetical protein